MIIATAISLAISAGVAGPCESACKAAPEAPAMTLVSVDHHASKDIVDTAVAAGSFNTLAAALKAADLVNALKGDGPFTVFAPTDAAFAKLPAGTVETLLKPENKDKLRAILLYHVVPGKAMAEQVVAEDDWATLNGQQVDITTSGDRVMIDNAQITKTDIKASNGVIHVIDTVIMPETRAIPAVAEAAGSFSTLLTAVKTAGLAETLSGEGPFTVFAPTDEAFAALGTTVQDLLKPENRETLKSILTYHVVPARVFADQAMELDSARTVNGKTLPINTKYGNLMVGDAKVVTADIDASNGVIHVIDSVLIPQ